MAIPVALPPPPPEKLLNASNPSRVTLPEKATIVFRISLEMVAHRISLTANTTDDNPNRLIVTRLPTTSAPAPAFVHSARSEGRAAAVSSAFAN